MKRIPTHPVSRKGFTLVETLVAITILMIAIAGPLVVASKGLNSALYAKDQMTASFLAQESMEMIKNAKDNNIDAGTGWLGSFGGCFVSSPCDASALDAANLNTLCSDSSGCRLYHSDTAGYNHSLQGSPTIFSRLFYIEAFSVDEVSVHVIVNWYEKTIPYQIHLTSQMTNSTRW